MSEKRTLIKIKGQEMRDNIPVLIFSKLLAEDEYPEKLLLEIKQEKKDTGELFPAKWFKIMPLKFDKVIFLLMTKYFEYLLQRGKPIKEIVYEFNPIVRNALRSANENLKNGIDDI